jgi:hypothetical protein
MRARRDPGKHKGMMMYDKAKALALVDEVAAELSRLRQRIESLPPVLSAADNSNVDAADCWRFSDELAEKLAVVTAPLGFHCITKREIEAEATEMAARFRGFQAAIATGADAGEEVPF